jgi:hypothetical protein
VKLQPPKPDINNYSDNYSNKVYDKLAHTTFNMYFRNFYETWDELGRFFKDTYEDDDGGSYDMSFFGPYPCIENNPILDEIKFVCR